MIAEFLSCTVEEAQERVSSRQYCEFQARYEHSPFGQQALHQQLAIFFIRVLRALGDEETQIEDMLWCPFEFKQKNRDVEDLDDDELEEIEAQQMEDLDTLESDIKRQKGGQSDEIRLLKKAEADEL